MSSERDTVNEGVPAAPSVLGAAMPAAQRSPEEQAKYDGLLQIGRDLVQKTIAILLYETYSKLAANATNKDDNLKIIVMTMPNKSAETPMIKLPINEAKFYKWHIAITFRVYSQTEPLCVDIVKSCYDEIKKLRQLIMFSAVGYWNEYRQRNADFVAALEQDCGIKLDLQLDEHNHYYFDKNVPMRAGIDVFYTDPEGTPFYKHTGKPPRALQQD